MSEQRHTPRVDAAMVRHETTGIWAIARNLERELATVTRERDEARAKVERLRALTICGCGDHFNENFRGTCPNCVAKEAKE